MSTKGRRCEVSTPWNPSVRLRHLLASVYVRQQKAPPSRLDGAKREEKVAGSVCRACGAAVIPLVVSRFMTQFLPVATPTGFAGLKAGKGGEAGDLLRNGDPTGTAR